MIRYIVLNYQSYIIPEYTIPCNGTVCAWSCTICHTENLKEDSWIEINPGVWRNIEDGVFELLRDNKLTFHFSSGDNGDNVHDGEIKCNSHYKEVEEQFIAPAGSVVGLHVPHNNHVVYLIYGGNNMG